MAGFVVDTSVLRVFSSMERLDLLDTWSPLVITPEIRREHGGAPAHGIAHLDAALASERIVEHRPNVRRQALALNRSNSALSYVDAESIEHAKQQGMGILVADKRFRDYARSVGIQTASVSTVLRALVSLKKLTDQEATSIAAQMQSRGYFRFNTDERKALRLL